MVGISYPGIAQLYVAQTQPPHLSAISPLSVIDDTYQGTLYPGGILNTGFAVPWANERADAGGAVRPGLGAGRSVDAGDTVCAANQALRLQNPDQLQLIKDNPFYTKAVGDPIIAERSSRTRSTCRSSWPAPGRTSRPAGTSRRCSTTSPSSPHLYATMINGSHTESLSLGVFDRYADFLDLYVGRRVPTGGARRSSARSWRSSLTGVTGLQLPPGINYTGMSYAKALKTFESQDPIRILFEEGAADGKPSGSPLPRFEKSFKSWPIERAKATAWYLTPGGKLAASRPSVAAPGKTKARSYRPTRRRCRRRRTPARAPASGPRTRRTTGSRSRRARASAGSPRR